VQLGRIGYLSKPPFLSPEDYASMVVTGEKHGEKHAEGASLLFSHRRGEISNSYLFDVAGLLG